MSPLIITDVYKIHTQKAFSVLFMQLKGKKAVFWKLLLEIGLRFIWQQECTGCSKKYH